MATPDRQARALKAALAERFGFDLDATLDIQATRNLSGDVRVTVTTLHVMPRGEFDAMFNAAGQAATDD